MKSETMKKINLSRKEARLKIVKLKEEISLLEEIANKPINLFEITNYIEVCGALGIEEKSVCDFDTLKEYRFHQIQNIEKLFNGDWKKDWSNSNQYKYYPYFRYTGSGLVFFFSYFDSYRYYGRVSYFKDKATSDYVGKTFINIYRDLMS